MKTCIVLGTRPEIIKMCPIVRQMEKRDADFFIVHTGQHYSYEMDRVFFDQLGLPKPRHNLNVGSGTHAEETARILIGIERVLRDERPDMVLVEGDTNSVLATALAAAKLFVDVGHVEAGLRSRDRSMPEETNRIVADHLSTCLFAPTETARQNLLAEGIDSSKIFVTGNTIVDAVSSMIPRVESHDASALTKGEGTLLLTLHRQENVDNEDRLRKIMNGLELVSMSLGCGVMFPIHPRTRKQMGRLGLRFDGWLKPLEPMDYISFLALLKRCKMVFTDSGGVQEEACILHVPCVTLRDNTERPETVQVGANVLAGAVPEVILEKAKMMYVIKRDWPNPYGDGRASERIVELVLKHG